MATVIFIKESKQTPSAMRGCIRYCVQEKKTVDENGRQYIGGVNCLGRHAYEEFMATKNLYGKASGTYFYQYVQSFLPGEIQSYEEAHRIGLEFAGKSFPGYEVLVATHLDAYDDHGVQRVHNHFLVNSVSFEDGRKIHYTPNTLQELRKISYDICRDHGLSVLPPSERRNGQGIGTREYRATMRGEGWKFGLINDIDTAMAQAGDRLEFCDILASVGYSVTWTDERKYITFTCPNGRKVRDNKLHDNKYTKENLEYEFRIRKHAAYTLGKYYADGKCLKKDIPKAIALLEQAAQMGDIHAEYRLAKIYLFESDCFDWQKAVEYLNTAAHKGNENAYRALQNMSQSTVISITTGIADLIGDLSAMFDERPAVEDCTTMPEHRERKKYEYEQSL